MAVDLREGWTELGSIAVGEGRRAVIYRDEAGRVGCATGGSLAGAEGNNPFVARVPVGTLVYGAMPAGATSVQIGAPVPASEVVVVSGAFLAVLPAKLDTRHVVAVFRDDRGATVPVPLPPGAAGKRVLKRTAVADADARCPACGECDWEAIEVPSAPGRIFTRERFVVCRVCGRAEGGAQGAGRRRAARLLNQAAVPRDIERPPGISEAFEPAEIVGAAGFMVYAVDSQLVTDTTVGCNYNGEGVTSVAVEQALVVGQTRIGSGRRGADQQWDPRRNAIRDLSSWLLDDAILEDYAQRTLSSPARTVATAEHIRATQARADASELRDITIEIDGHDLPFLQAAVPGNRWVAKRIHGDVLISIRGRECSPDDIRLVAITNPNEYFASAHTRRRDGSDVDPAS